MNSMNDIANHPDRDHLFQRLTNMGANAEVIADADAKLVEAIDKHPDGLLTLTQTGDGEVVAITWQDDDYHILSLLWDREMR